MGCLLCSLTAFPLYAFDATTHIKNHVFYTEGVVDAIDWYDRGLAAMSDFGNYRLWAPRGIDGKDGVSAAFWENFVDFQFVEPDIMEITYNLNLGWPLGSKGNKVRLKIDSSQLANGVLSMHITKKIVGIEDARLNLYAEDSPTKPGTKQIRFQIAMRFGWLLEALMDPAKYSHHMNVVIGIMINNLKEYSSNPENMIAGIPLQPLNTDSQNSPSPEPLSSSIPATTGNTAAPPIPVIASLAPQTTKSGTLTTNPGGLASVHPETQGPKSTVQLKKSPVPSSVLPTSPP